jgi:hypothetical protein
MMRFKLTRSRFGRSDGFSVRIFHGRDTLCNIASNHSPALAGDYAQPSPVCFAKKARPASHVGHGASPTRGATPPRARPSLAFTWRFSMATRRSSLLLTPFDRHILPHYRDRHRYLPLK